MRSRIVPPLILAPLLALATVPNIPTGTMYDGNNTQILQQQAASITRQAQQAQTPPHLVSGTAGPTASVTGTGLNGMGKGGTSGGGEH